MLCHKGGTAIKKMVNHCCDVYKCLMLDASQSSPVGRWRLPVAARIKFKSLMLAYKVLDGSAPTYLNALVRANVTPRMLRSSSERRLALPSVQARQSRLFSFVVPRWWNELPS